MNVNTKCNNNQNMSLAYMKKTSHNFSQWAYPSLFSPKPPTVCTVWNLQSFKP